MKNLGVGSNASDTGLRGINVVNTEPKSPSNACITLTLRHLGCGHDTFYGGQDCTYPLRLPSKDTLLRRTADLCQTLTLPQGLYAPHTAHVVAHPLVIECIVVHPRLLSPPSCVHQCHTGIDTCTLVATWPPLTTSSISQALWNRFWASYSRSAPAVRSPFGLAAARAPRTAGPRHQPRWRSPCCLPRPRRPPVAPPPAPATPP